MCSSPKASQDLKVKKIPTSSLNQAQLSNFVAIANAADTRREAKEQAEQAALKQSQRLERAEHGYALTQKERQGDSFLNRLLIACHFM
jgi:hypothetical protein